MKHKSHVLSLRLSDEDNEKLGELLLSYNLPPADLIRYLIKKEHARIFPDSSSRATVATTQPRLILPK